MKILILSTFPSKVGHNHNHTSTSILVQHLDKNHQVKVASYSEVKIILDKKTSILIGNTNLLNFDFIIFRTLSDHGINENWENLAKEVAYFCQRNNIQTLNGNNLASHPTTFSKMYQGIKLSMNNIPTPQSWWPQPKEKNKKYIKKPFIGEKGREISIVDFKKTLFKNNVNFFYQEILPNHFDYRVIVLNNKSLGTIRRTAEKGSVVSNVSAGGHPTLEKTTREIELLSIKVAKLFNLDFCGIDLMISKDKQLQVLEVNRFPGFIGFQKATQINVSEQLETYINSFIK